MARIDVTDEAVVIRLSTFEKVAGLLGDQEIPLAAVTDVEVVSDPLTAMRGLRAPGLAVPGRTRIGTWRGGGRRQMVRVRAGRQAVRIGADGQRFDSYLVDAYDPAAVADAIRAAAGGA